MVEIVLWVLIGIPAVLLSRTLCKPGAACGRDANGGDGKDCRELSLFGHDLRDVANRCEAQVDPATTEHLEMIALEVGRAADVNRHVINPATGLLMISGDESGLDIMGNPYGFDFQHDLPDGLGGVRYGGAGACGVDTSGLGDGPFGGSGHWGRFLEP